MDGLHPQQNSKPAYGWFKKGGKSILKANTGRKRININGALDPDNLELIYSSDDTINARSTIKLFKAIENKYPTSKKIIIICDNARYYRSKMVKEYLEDSKIEIKFLPPYSPNLNLIERLWRFMNKQVRDNKYYEKFQEFQEAIFGFLEKISSYHAELKNLLNEKFHIYDF